MIVRTIIGRFLLMIVLAAPSAMLQAQSLLDVMLEADALSKSGQYKRAAGILSAAIENKSDLRLILQRATVYFNSGEYDKAADDYTLAGNIKKGAGDYGLARISAIKGDAAGAVLYLEKSMKSEFKTREKEILLDAAFTRIETRPEWRDFWKKDWYTTPELKLAEAEYYISAGKRDEAGKIISELGFSYPGNSETQYAKALYLVAEEKSGEAMSIISKLISESPGNEKYLRLLADLQYKASNFAGASGTYTRMIEMEVPDASLFISRAGCYVKTGELARALADVTKYLSFYPSDQKALSMAGRLELAGGNNFKALGYYSRNIELHPGDAACYTDRAATYFLTKSWQLAIRDYSMALDLDPGNSEAWLNKGIALLNTGKAADACYDFRKSFELGNRKAVEYISDHCLK